MPIVGSFAGASSRAYGLQAGVLVGDFESISTVTVTSATSVSMTFSSIPQTYQHLQIRLLGRTNRGYDGNYIDAIQMEINSSSNLTKVHQLTGSGSSASSNATELPYVVQNGSGPTATNAALFSPVIIDILDYKDTNKFKTMRAIWGVDVNASGGGVGLNSGYWGTTNAITDIRLFLTTGSSWLQNSTASLYGIKG